MIVTFHINFKQAQIDTYQKIFDFKYVPVIWGEYINF